MSDTFDPQHFLQSTGDVAYDWDIKADRITWYGDTRKFFGGDAPCDYDSFYRMVITDDRSQVFSSDQAHIDRQFRLCLADQRVVTVHERGEIIEQNGAAITQRGLLRHISKKQLRATAAATAESHGYDALTGCINRSHMQEQVGKVLTAGRGTDRQHAYIAIGIDKMSFVNEAVGMEAGDVLLQNVAARISKLIPPLALLGRVGGDMFGVFLPDPLSHDYPLLAERLLQSFRDQPVVTSVTPLHITVSIGGVQLPSVAKSASEGMIFAEQALHDARQRGRNLFIEYCDSPERVQEHRQLLELGESIKHAFKNNGFRLAYQPIIDGATGNVLMYEALVRMFDHEKKPIPAAHFVPAIEQLGMAYELDKRVLDLAIKELEAHPDLVLAVNVSGLTASQAGWVDHVGQVLGLRAQVAKRLVFEITETAAIFDVAETKRFAARVVELGGRMSLDDFGAGFTSIRHLRSLPFSIMKIDKDLLYNLVGHAEQQHLVRVLIELARGLGLKTVAEGVENEDIATWLRKEKVDMMQGYLFGKPSFDRLDAPLHREKNDREKIVGTRGDAPVMATGSNVVSLPRVVAATKN